MFAKYLFYRENQAKLKELSDFFRKIQECIKDSSKLQKIQSYLALHSGKVDEILADVDDSTILGYGSRALGYQWYSITMNIPFFISEYIKSQDWWSTSGNVLGDIETRYLRAIGIYTDNQKRSIYNIFNPLIWFHRISRLLLQPITKIFNISYSSKPLQLIQLILDTIMAVGSIIQILQWLS